jgi:hypothetical protein
MSTTFKPSKLTAVPTLPCDPNAVFFVAPTSKPNYVEIYVSNSAGTALKRLLTDADIQALIDASISGLAGEMPIVADIAARNALSPTKNTQVLVLDATGDSTVASGAATYLYRVSTTSWIKLSETDGDKGDITVSNSGATWTIDNQSVDYSKLQQTNGGNIALGNPTNGSGTITEIPIGVGANNLVQLDNTAKLPAVDGSQLTNLPVLSATQIRDSLTTLTGNDRLDASTIKNLPTGGGSGGLNIVSPTANNFPVVANDLVVANNFSVALPSTPQENTIIYFLVLENPCLIAVTGTITLNSQVAVSLFKINPQGFIIPLLFKNSRWNILPSYVSDIVLSTNFINLSNYQSPGDTNGIIYYLGTTAINSQTFVNPVPSQVVATSSGVHDPGPTFGLQGATDRNLATAWHASSATPSPSQIFQLDFQDRKVDLTRIVIRPWARTDGLPAVSPTIVEASNDGLNWTAIHSFTGSAFAGQDLISPEIPASGTPSRYIRFRRTSGTSDNWWQQALGEIELYGFLYQVINLVSNLPPTTPESTEGLVSFNQWLRSSFTTGSSSYGYTLDSVTLRFRQDIASPNLFVRLYSDNAGSLGNLITSFTNPSSITTTNNNNTFTLTTPQTLAANTTYWLVAGISSSNSGQYSWRATNSVNQTGEPNWSIGDSALFSGNQGGTWNTFSGFNAFQFSVNG